MSFLKNVTKGKKPGPRRTVIAAVHGWGKSSLAAQWPNPVFVNLENGIDDLDVASGPLCETLADAWGGIHELASPDSEHDFETVVIDSGDWVEKLIHHEVATGEGFEAITDFDFGKGYGKAFAIWESFLKALESCYRDRGLYVVVLCHVTTTKVEPPTKASYTKHTPKLRPECVDKLCEWADEVLFGDYAVDVRQADEGFKKKRGIAIGDGSHLLFTKEQPGHTAKNRLSLPPILSVPPPFTPEAAELVNSLTGRA